MDIPCHKHCPDRASDCHISCERYKVYREHLDKKNAEIRKENSPYGYRCAKKVEITTRMMKHKPKWGSQ